MTTPTTLQVEAEQMLADHYAGFMGKLGKAARPGQLSLIQAGVTMFGGERLLVNAPTATGKSLGALIIGGMRAQGLGERTVIATFTRLLQDQYAGKDLTEAQTLFPAVRFAVLKGAANYLCRENAKDGQGNRYTALVEGSGDPGEIGSQPLWSAAADADSCGKHTPERCGYAAAKKRAKAAHVVITNHALVLINAMNNVVLGEHALLIVDEIHNFPRAAESFGTKVVDFDKINKKLTVSEDTLKEMREQGGEELAEQFVQGSEKAIGIVNRIAKIMETKQEEYKPSSAQVLAGIAEFKTLGQWARGDEGVILIRQWLTAAHEQIARPHSGLKWVATVERTFKNARRAKLSLVDIADVAKRGLKTELVLPGSEETGEEERVIQRGVLMMSATTGTPEKPLYVAERCGVEAELLKVPSPLDYPGSMRLSAVEAGPARAWPDTVERLCRETSGRTLVLLRSWWDVDRVADHLEYGDFPYPVYRQDQESPANNVKRVKAFRDNTSSVLIGTASFFEGIDVPGDSLSQVIIGKLPVRLAQGPVDHERVKQWGRDYLENIQVPHTALLLEQMMGRLVRSVTDRGLVAVLDEQARTGWGRQALVSAAGAFGIPLVPRAEALEWFNAS